MTAGSDRSAINDLIHDSVLPTLLAIARGHVAADDDRLRRRCASDADRLRRLISRTPAIPVPENGLALALAEVADRMEAIGLRVSLLTYPADHPVPAPVVQALSLAANEALNNVREHARVDNANLTATLEDGTVVVRVVDRGVGFDPFAAVDGGGLGLRGSIAERVERVGGRSLVHSRPGEGACVELRWPA